MLHQLEVDPIVFQTIFKHDPMSPTLINQLQVFMGHLRQIDELIYREIHNPLNRI